MNAEPIPFPQRYLATRYDAFQIGEGGRTYALDPLDAGTLEEALNEVLVRYALSHKQHLLIRATGEREVKLHLFAIKKRSAPTYIYKDYQTKRVERLYAAPVCTIDGSVL